MPDFKPFCLEVWGDYACFTRPELKVERHSYDVPTPSAVRAVFEAILWKPAIRWHVRRIEVLAPIKWASIRRNEVSLRASPRSPHFFIEDARSQRAATILRDVRYRFYATLEYIPPDQRPKATTAETLPQDPEERQLHGAAESAGKYLAMFERRASRGQCVMQPYLGCREFSCFFRFVENPDADPATPISETRDLGIMLYDLDFSNPDDPQPMFFRARLDNGIIDVPPLNSSEILR
ncbi:MAG: type I-C CRISPR-associated protein Cas5c [Bacteroidota bacterium]|nr:type I-C CRISPR-associated protein Cas5c [Candidatus Kapabacteria bacterium]MCS7303378.1 type I-C CRISPR-associated protein Cas5c [Candidatus Kapabacteria bacterium]MDW8075954.1 type I-C CRISPR-associated protein Cas5c [Bacteroidota bacterium]MDW8272548.1 type I-C CRISPR-associated protein Cas5c [Bacteroidota bacterium]